MNSRAARGVETLGRTERGRARRKKGDSLPKTEALPGSLQSERKACGKPTCRCARGRLHGPYFYRRWREGGRQRRGYVKPRDVASTRAALVEWRQLHPPAYRVRHELAVLRRLLHVLEALGV